MENNKDTPEVIKSEAAHKLLEKIRAGAVKRQNTLTANREKTKAIFAGLMIGKNKNN
jgi:hypothetical protein